MLADKIISTGFNFIGTPYVFNAPSFQTDRFDCSSFIQHIFKVNGISLPRNSRQQFQVGKSISYHAIKRETYYFLLLKSEKKKWPI